MPLRGRTPALIALGALIATVALLAGAPGTVTAADGLRIENTTTYTIDPTSGVVRAQVDLTLTNTVPDRVEGNLINRVYFTGFTMPIPVDAVNAAAVTSRGTALDVSLEPVPDLDDYVVLEIDFANRLFYQETTRITVTYDLLGRPPRDPNPSRVNPAYAAFTAYGVGDPGRVTVRVVVPSNFEVDRFGSDVVITEEGPNTVYTAAGIQAPDEFSVFISARDDAALASSDATLAGHDFAIRYWPGDEAWRQFVEQQVSDGLPVLEELIGLPWTRDTRFEIRQANSAYFYGYAGWFSGANNEIEMGEQLDQETMLHELSHAWFNDELLDSRWLNEGLAQTYSNLAMAELGGTAGDPTTPDATQPGATKLEQWDQFVLEETDADREEFGYNASWYVVDSIVDEVGVAEMAGIIAALAEDTGTYPGEEDVTDVPRTVAAWQQFLDLTQNVAGSQSAEDLLGRWVLDESSRDLLEDRAETRERFTALDTEGGSWDVPVVIRDAMGAWVFPRANELIDDADEALERRDAVIVLSDELDVEVPADFEARYQQARDLTDVVSALDDQLDALQAVEDSVAAEAADPSFIARIGLIGADLDTPLAEARAALSAGETDRARERAEAVQQVLADADDVGTGRLLRTGAALLGLIVVIGAILVVRRRRRQQPVEDGSAAAAVGGLGAEGVLVEPLREVQPLEDELDGGGDGSR